MNNEDFNWRREQRCVVAGFYRFAFYDPIARAARRPNEDCGARRVEKSSTQADNGAVCERSAIRFARAASQAFDADRERI